MRIPRADRWAVRYGTGRSGRRRTEEQVVRRIETRPDFDA